MLTHALASLATACHAAAITVALTLAQDASCTYPGYNPEHGGCPVGYQTHAAYATARYWDALINGTDCDWQSDWAEEDHMSTGQAIVLRTAGRAYCESQDR